MGTARYSWKERLFFAVAWTPKATVQASLSAVPLALINRTMVDSPDYEQWVRWGEDCLATGIFAIIVCATLGTLLVFWFAPILLEKEVRGKALVSIHHPALGNLCLAAQQGYIWAWQLSAAAIKLC